MITKQTLLFLFLSSSFILSGQVIDPLTLPAVQEYTVVRTNPDADTVILALHGGPSAVLFEGSFTYLETIPTFSVVEVKKQEMLDADILFNDTLTFEEAVLVNDKTAALIEKAVQFFKDQDKTVVLIGQSWGAIVLGEYLDDYGVESIHRIIPMEGRLNMPLDFVDYLLDGILPTFDADGFTYVFGTPQGTYDQGLLTLGAAAFANRWIDSLANMDLTKMMYTYAENDMNTGALLPEELDFLDDSGAQTLFISPGIHGDSYLDEYQAVIVEFIRSEFVTDVSESFVIADHLKLYPTLAQNQIQVETTTTGVFSIFNINGQEVHQETPLSDRNSIDVSALGVGPYVGVFRSGGKEISTVKFQVVR